MREIITRNVYATYSAVWSLNERKKSVSLLIINSLGMSKSFIEYKPHCKNYLKHRNRIRRIAG